MEQVTVYTRAPKKKMNCDEVAWIMTALERMQGSPTLRVTDAIRVATLLEIMDILDYEFEDRAAAGNALSSFPEFDEMRGINDATR